MTSDGRWETRARILTACCYNWVTEGHNGLEFFWHFRLVQGRVRIALESTRDRDVFLFPKRLRETLYASMRSLGIGSDIGYVFAAI